MSMVRDFSKITFTLPSTIVSRTDMAHLIQAIEKCDQDLTARHTRQRSGVQSSQADVVLPELMQSFLAANQLTLGDDRERQALLAALERTKKTLPVVHITFAAEADREHLEQMAVWFRSHVHPQVVIEVGLQPALIAGAYVRTPNHVYDLSMRGALRSGRTILRRELGALRGV